MLVFNGGGIMIMKNNQPPSKTSMSTHFRGWWDGGAEEQLTTIKNEHTHLFSMVVGCGKQLGFCKGLN